MVSRALASPRLLIVLSIAILGLIAGAIFGYTAAFFAYLWLHPPSPARFEFAGANRLSLGVAVAGALGGTIGGGWLGWRLTRRRVEAPLEPQKGNDERQNHPPEPSV